MRPEEALVTGYQNVPRSTVRGHNGIDYVYRRRGVAGDRPLVLLHFRGNLNNWDPALVNALALSREVIAFDKVGVGASSGSVLPPPTPSLPKSSSR